MKLSKCYCRWQCWLGMRKAQTTAEVAERLAIPNDNKSGIVSKVFEEIQSAFAVARRPDYFRDLFEPRIRFQTRLPMIYDMQTSRD